MAFMDVVVLTNMYFIVLVWLFSKGCCNKGYKIGEIITSSSLICFSGFLPYHKVKFHVFQVKNLGFKNLQMIFSIEILF